MCSCTWDGPPDISNSIELIARAMARERRRGRRRKSEGDTRAAILAVALRRFAASGFEGTTSVEIAREAGVDPALILYYFDSKETLLFEAVRANLTPQLETAFANARLSPRIGEQIVGTFLDLWDKEDQGRALAAIIRAGVSNERIGRLFREFIATVILPQVVRRLGPEGREFRVGLAATQLFGLGLARYVLRLEPVASARRDDLVAAVGPTITRYLTAPVP